MAQINLLSSNTSASKSNTGEVILKLSVKILAVVLGAVVLYYGWLLLSSHRTNLSTESNKKRIIEAQTEISGRKERQELIVRQGQLSALNGLLQNHVYWSNLFPKLAEATLNTVSYLSFSADDQGKGTMTVSVPSYAELDKFLQVFDLQQFNENFSNIRISSISRSQKGSTLETRAEIQFNYNNSLIKKPVSQQ